MTAGSFCAATGTVVEFSTHAMRSPCRSGHAQFENPLAPDRALQMKARQRMAGTEQVFTKPKTYKT